MNTKTTLFYFLFLFLIIISGCTTPYDLKKTKPIVTYTTSKSLTGVKKCILNKWHTHITGVYEEKTAEGWIIRLNDTFENATIAIVTFDESESGIDVNYYNRNKKLRSKFLEEEVLACR